jgi:2-C-methyl-D-erythritol 2,4-cyclodiphosphate synthase
MYFHGKTLTGPWSPLPGTLAIGDRYGIKTGMMRIGMGYDVHRLVTGRPLVLGGVTIPHEQGLLGHSDADVLVHAVCDALLGAAGLGDIGTHFPDTDPSLAGIDSLVLLVRCTRMVAKKGWTVGNLDATLFAQAPRMAPFREAMAANIARATGITPAQVNVKATTTEGLGPFGRGEGIGAACVAMLVPLAENHLSG